MTPAGQDTSLEVIRREIDAIDDGLLDLLSRRITASDKVRAFKSHMGSLASSPIRPAREALILRRLIARSGSAVSADLLVRLWRVILTSSTLAQAPVTAHISRTLSAKMQRRLVIRDHFCATPVSEHEDEATALAQLQSRPGDICIVECRSAWAGPLVEGAAGEARVIGVLPVLRTAAEPELLVIGLAEAQGTGGDETIVLSEGSLPRDFVPAPVWQFWSGSHSVSSLPGFLSGHEGPLAALMRSNATLGLRIVGRYPSLIEVKP